MKFLQQVNTHFYLTSNYADLWLVVSVASAQIISVSSDTVAPPQQTSKKIFRSKNVQSEEETKLQVNIHFWLVDSTQYSLLIGRFSRDQQDREHRETLSRIFLFKKTILRSCRCPDQRRQRISLQIISLTRVLRRRSRACLLCSTVRPKKIFRRKYLRPGWPDQGSQQWLNQCLQTLNSGKYSYIHTRNHILTYDWSTQTHTNLWLVVSGKSCLQSWVLPRSQSWLWSWRHHQIVTK